MANQTKKLYVFDTSVIMHDPNSIKKFQEHDICVLTTVLEELEVSKKWNDNQGFIAREFLRELDKLGDIVSPPKANKKGSHPAEEYVCDLFNGGVSLGEGLGNIQMKVASQKLHPTVKNRYFEEKPDNRILSAVFQMQKDEKGKRQVILVSKDTGLRLKAKSFGIKVEDYQNDKVPNLDKLYLGRGEINDGLLDPVIDKLCNYSSGGKAPIFDEEYSKCINKEMIKPNKFFVLKSGTKTCLARVDRKMEYFHRVEKKMIFGITPRNAEQAFTVDALLQQDIKLLTLLGKAGTGKTLLAMAAAIHLHKEGKYDNIVIAAAMVPLSNKDIGALPGDAKEKVSPYMQGLYDNLAFIQNQMKGKKVPFDQRKAEPESSTKNKRRNSKQPPPPEEKLDYIALLKKEEKIKIQPLASIRGRSINDTIFIIDEAQNLTPHEVKTIITRAGENTKMIFCGDVQQIDSPYLDAHSNGLSNAVHNLGGHEIVAHVTLEKGERSELANLAADLL